MGIYTTSYTSPCGQIELSADELALLELSLPGQPHRFALQGHAGETEVLIRTKQWLDRYFGGEQPSPEALPLNPHGSAFAQRVWKLLLEIPYGATCSYGALARHLAEERGIPKLSAQAVGHAVGQNPIAIVIPCHRVIGSNGSLIGYAGGLERKRFLLEYEKAVLAERGMEKG